MREPKIFLDKGDGLNYDFVVVLNIDNNVSGSKSSAYRDVPKPETLRMGERTMYPINKYDERHDVLHVYLNRRCNEYDASADEEYPDVYVLKDDDTNEIVGFKILNFKKNESVFKKYYPQYDL